MNKIVPVTAVIVLAACAGVGWKMFTDRQAFQAEVDTARASCKTFQDFMAANDDVSLIDTAAWGRAKTALEAVSDERINTDPTTTTADCNKGLAHAQDAPIEGQLALDLALVETAAAAAETEGIDLGPIKVTGKAEDISDDISAANFDLAKEAIENLGEEITQQRSLFHQGQADHVIADMIALNEILALFDDRALSSEPIMQAKSMLMEDFSDENVARLTKDVAEGTALVAQTITEASQPALAALTARFGGLEALDAARADPAFPALKQQFEDTIGTEPVDVETLSVFTSRAGKLDLAIGTFGGELIAKLISGVEAEIFAAKAEGMGSFVPSFKEAEEKFQALSSGGVKLAEIPSVQAAITDAITSARGELSTALEQNTSLRTDLAVILSTADERGLGTSEPFAEIIGKFEEVDALDVFTQNSALTNQISSVQEFLDRLDVGE